MQRTSLYLQLNLPLLMLLTMLASGRAVAAGPSCTTNASVIPAEGFAINSPDLVITGVTTNAAGTKIGNIGIGTTTPSAQFHVTQSDASAPVLSVTNQPGNNLFSINDGGPSLNLSNPSLNSTLNISSSNVNFNQAFTLSNNAGATTQLRGNLSITGSQRLNTPLIVGAATVLPRPEVSSNPLLSLSVRTLSSQPFNGTVFRTLYQPASGTSAPLVATSSKQVGINQPSPSQPLDIDGTLWMTKSGKGIRLKPLRSAPPGNCIAGAFALTSLYTLCVCKVSSSWINGTDGSSCKWNSN